MAERSRHASDATIRSKSFSPISSLLHRLVQTPFDQLALFLLNS
jgi:hypothetical protein